MVGFISVTQKTQAMCITVHYKNSMEKATPLNSLFWQQGVTVTPIFPLHNRSDLLTAVFKVCILFMWKSGAISESTVVLSM